MSDLQLILIGLGLLLVIGVVIYNWRQEKKLRQHISNDFAMPQEDVLVDSSSESNQFADDVELGEVRKVTPSSEPAAVEPPPVTAAPAVETPVVQETVSEPVEVPEAPVVETLAPVEPELAETVEPPVVQTPPEPPVETAPETTALPDTLHAEVDLIAILSSAQAVNGHAVYTMLQDTLKEGGVQVMQFGLGSGGIWQSINDTTSQHATFTQVACGLQLADRRGPVPKAVINKFQFAMENIGVELAATVAWQSEGDAAQRAVALDAFCIDVDQLVSVHLVHGESAIHGTKFRGLAEANDLKLADGKFCFFGENEPTLPLFTLSNADNQPFTTDSLRLNVVKGAVFQIEVPKLVSCEQTFNQMILVAQQMASSLGASLVDDNQRPLGDVQIDKIRQQLKVIHNNMVARSITPGSDVSLRLFN